LAIAQAAVEPPKQVAALPDDAAGSDADANTETPADAQTASLPLPPPRPGLASLLVGEAVPVPAPRPNITFPVPRRVIRRSAAARPVRSTRPIDPLSALFGIGQPPGTVQR
jgi:hypothetical protein